MPSLVELGITASVGYLVVACGMVTVGEITCTLHQRDADNSEEPSE